MAALVAEAISAYIPRIQKELDFWEALENERPKSIMPEDEERDDDGSILER